MKSLFLLLLLLFVFSSCGSKSIEEEKGILGIWRMSESIDHSNQSNSSDPLLNEAKKLEEGKDGHVLAVFPDNSFTEFKGSGDYAFGKWNWIEAGKKIQLNYSDKKAVFNVKYDFTDTNNCAIKFENSKKEITFFREAKLLEKYKEEPFYSANNIWRLKPKKPESKQELENRLANYFQHMLYLLKAADIRKLDVVSFEFSMGIIKIYNGGIGIHDLENIPMEWQNTYYDERDVMTIHNMYADYLSTSRYRGASTGNWVKDDYKIALSIYDDIKSGKLETE